MDKLVLSYHDSCLYHSDIGILKSPSSWLSDRIISWYFEYLQHDVFVNDQVLFLGPEVTQAIKMIENPSEVKAIFLDHLLPSSRSFIIFAINNNSSTDAGGSHWSLGVFSRAENTFYHFDSSSGMNHSAFLGLVKIFKTCFETHKADVVEVPCLQQEDAYNCGIFVLCHTDSVCKAIEQNKPLSGLKKLLPTKTHVKRTELIEIIRGLGGDV